MKRARNESGLRTHIEHRTPMRQSLVYAVLGAPEPLVRSEPKVYHGPKPAGRGGIPKLTDGEILRVRALHKFHGLRPADIASETGLELGPIESALTYMTRVHLEPRPEHATLRAQTA